MIAAPLPATAHENRSMLLCELAKSSTSIGGELQHSKDALLRTEDHCIVEFDINCWDQTISGGSTGDNPTVELTFGMQPEPQNLRLEVLQNCVSLGPSGSSRIQNKHANNSLNASAINSPEVSPEISPILIQKTDGINKEPLKHQRDFEMNLDRDLPPLPVAADLQALVVSDQSDQHSLELKPQCNPESLKPLCYDPVIDSLKHGGIHYYPDGMRYHPESPQHLPQILPTLEPNATPVASSMTTYHQHKEVECLKAPLTARIPTQDASESSSTSDINHISSMSSGILGNFIPVNTMGPASALAVTTLNLHKIE